MTFWNNLYRAKCPLCGRSISKTNMSKHHAACKRKREREEQPK